MVGCGWIPGLDEARGAPVVLKQIPKSPMRRRETAEFDHKAAGGGI
jgi:hypothetical protein